VILKTWMNIPQMQRNLLFKYLLKALALMMGVSASMSWGADALPIYYSSVISAKVRQDAIQNEFKKKNLQPTVFAKFRDFIDQVKQASPKILVAPSYFDKYYPGYRPVLHFNYAGGKSFRYQILALAEWEGKSLNSGRIGVVEEVGRDHLADWLSQLTGAKFKMVRAVTKPEDLFSMLVFKAADLILVSPDNLKGLREQFVTQVKTIKQSIPVKGPTVYFKKDFVSQELMEGLLKLSDPTLTSLGFSSIESGGGNPE
jgi:hypothetical protein